MHGNSDSLHNRSRSEYLWRPSSCSLLGLAFRAGEGATVRYRILSVSGLQFLFTSHKNVTNDNSRSQGSPNISPPPTHGSVAIAKAGTLSPYVWLLLALSLGLNLYGIHWGLPNGIQDWANDSLAPLGPLVYAKRLIFQEPWSSKYPPFHYMVLSLFSAPYALYLYLTGGLASPSDIYPYGLKDPEFSLMVFTLIARLISALMSTGTVLVTYLTVRHFYGHRAGLLSALLITSSYAIIYYAHNANVEAPLLFWIALALYSFVLLLKTYKTKYYILLGLFTAFSVGTKDSAYALFPGLALSLLWSHIRHEQTAGEGGRFLAALLHRKLLYGFAAFAIAFILVFNLPLNWQGFVDHVRLHQAKGSVAGSLIIHDSDSILQGELTLITKYLFHLLQINGLPAFLLLLGGFLYCLVKFPAHFCTLMIPIMTYYILFLRLYPVAGLRYLLPVYLLLTWHTGKFVVDLLDYKKLPKLVSTTALLFVLGYSLAYGFSLDLLLLRDSRYYAEQWIKKNIPSGASVVAYGPSYSLPRFPSDMHLNRIDLSRGISDPRALCSPSHYRAAGSVESVRDPLALTFSAVDNTRYTLTLYFVDWDSHDREQIITLRDWSTNKLLDQRTLTDFHDGVYYTYAVQGSIHVEVTKTRGGSAVLSGIFWDKVTTSQSLLAFLGADVTTQGIWRGVYGSEGFILVSHMPKKRDIVQLPSYISSYSYSNITGRMRLLPDFSEDAASVSADYVVLNLSLPTRVTRQSQIYQSFAEEGYRPVASLQSRRPLIGANVFHAVNPKIVIFKQYRNQPHRRAVHLHLKRCKQE